MVESPANGSKNLFQKEILVILLILILIAALLSYPATVAYAHNTVSAVVLMDAKSGEILYAQNPDRKMEIASTTKILTAITVIERGDITQIVEIPAVAVGVEGSSIYLREGEKWRVSDLLFGLMLRSGNDAAVALAIATAGSTEAFANMMNETAEKAGASRSHFANPHGLHDDKHYSTALDLALITRYALKNEIFSEICRTKTHSCEKESEGKKVKAVFYNKNKLLYSYPNATGVKTGFTKHSGRCLVASAAAEGRELICVTLNVSDTYGVTKELFDRYLHKSKAG